MSSQANVLANSTSELMYISESYTTAGPADVGTAIDVTEAEGLVAVELSLKNIAGTNPTLDVKARHSTATAGTYSDVSGGAFAQSTGATTEATNTHQTVLLDKRDLHGFLKVNVTVGGTSSPEYAYTVTVRYMKKISP